MEKGRQENETDVIAKNVNKNLLISIRVQIDRGQISNGDFVFGMMSSSMEGR